MTINILYLNNGVGLTRDANILQQILVATGHEVRMIQTITDRPVRQHETADIAIHLEHSYFRLFSGYNSGVKNIYFPNPEWYHESKWNTTLNKFDVICCKTHDCYNVFKDRHANVIYTGFTSVDRFDPSVEKIKSYIHAAGKSTAKNTLLVYRVWNPTFGKIIMLSQCHRLPCKSNILFTDWIGDQELKLFQNRCLIHVCPSDYEGFGHYINEARSCSAVIITTNGAPMNEFVTKDNGFFVERRGTQKKQIVQISIISELSLSKAIKQVEQTSIETLIEMGKKSREMFLSDDKQFKTKLLTVINNI